MAKEIKKDRREDLFAATPPLEAKKILFSLWASIPGMCLDFGDVVRAYFHAKATQRVYVELPKEDFEDGKCGVLKKAMYGTRDAAQNWEMEYTEMMINAGFIPGRYSACVFYHGERNVRVVIHGDDFTVLGPGKSLDWFLGIVQQRMEVKFQARLERGKPGAVRILNRIIIVTDKGLQYEADQRRAEIILRDMGVDTSAKEVATPGVSSIEGGQVQGDQVRVESLFRAVAARGNYLGQDRMDMQFAAEEILRFMAKPEDQDWRSAKRLARSFKGNRRVVIEY